MNSYLEHFGIKGQHWGVRRFQNEDGSYTAEGKERYGRGVSGGISPVVPAMVAKKVATKLIKRHTIKKEIEKNELNKDRERISKKDITRLVNKKYNRKERNVIYDRMKKDKDMHFDEARKPADRMRRLRALRNTALFIGAHVGVAMLVLNRQKIANSLGRNKSFQSFMKNVKHRSMKNSIVLKDSDYSIDKPRALPSGRG